MKIILVAPNAWSVMGGEAIKVIEFFRHLLETGQDVVLVTHARNRDFLQAEFPATDVRYVADSRLQEIMNRSPLRRLFMDAHFQWHARSLIRAFDPRDSVIHFLCPISPVQPKFPPRGYRYVIGPLNGNLAYPPGFRAQMPRSSRLGAQLYPVVQWLLGRLVGDKRRADRILVAGGDRSRRAVVWAGATEAQLIDVHDSGVPARLATRPAVHHVGPNRRFMSAGRLDGYKGFDMAIAAIAAAGPEYSLSIYGDGGRRAELEALTARLGVSERVTFHGWTSHDQLIEAMRSYRGMLFPTLAEANGIIMQEAMMVGLPVVALCWGGPAILGADGAAVLLDPVDPATVVRDMADAIRRLALDDAHANHVAGRARQRAETTFLWGDVTASWTVAHAEAMAVTLPHGLRPA